MFLLLAAEAGTPAGSQSARPARTGRTWHFLGLLWPPGSSTEKHGTPGTTIYPRGPALLNVYIKEQDSKKPLKWRVDDLFARTIN